MEFVPIGYLKSSFPDKFGTPRQPGLVRGAQAELKIRADLQPELALQGLEAFSHVWLIFIFHKNQTARYHAKVHPPRLQGQNIGLFATRSPHRPNPLGLSLVELKKIDKDTLILEGIDLIDGTPILDVKPYLPEVESQPQALVGWPCGRQLIDIQVEFSDEAQEILNLWQSHQRGINLFQHITDVLGLDPRPLVYKGFEGQESPYRQEHRVRLYDGDIHFQFLSSNRVRVHRVIWPCAKGGTIDEKNNSAGNAGLDELSVGSTPRGSAAGKTSPSDSHS